MLAAVLQRVEQFFIFTLSVLKKICIFLCLLIIKRMFSYSHNLELSSIYFIYISYEKSMTFYESLVVVLYVMYLPSRCWPELFWQWPIIRYII